MPKKKLKHNPKLDESRDNKKKSSYQGKIEVYENLRSHSKFYMALVFVGVIVVIIVLVVTVFTQSGVRIQNYDLVRLDYQIYSQKRLK